MSFIDEYTKHIPKYYHTMHLDGYEPWEIFYASRKRSRRQAREYLAARAARKQATAEDVYDIKITSEVKVK